MNSRHSSSRGNAFIYVLIAIILFAGLTFALSRSFQGETTEDLDTARADLLAEDLLAYVNTAQRVIDQMDLTGTGTAEYNFIDPEDPAFDTPPNIHKVYHPEGGGLQWRKGESYGAEYYNPAFPANRKGWVVQTVTSVEWSKSATNDILLTFRDLRPEVCAAINRKLAGSTTIPVATATLVNLFEENAGTDLDLTTARCAGCTDKPALCLQDSAGQYGFYTMLVNN